MTTKSVSIRIIQVGMIVLVPADLLQGAQFATHLTDRVQAQC